MENLLSGQAGFLFITLEEHTSLNQLLVIIWVVTIFAIGYYFAFVRSNPQRLLRTFRAIWHDLGIRKHLIRLENFQLTQERKIQILQDHTNGTLDKLANSAGISLDVERQVRKRLEIWESLSLRHYELITEAKRLKEELLVFRKELHLLHYLFSRIEETHDFRMDISRLSALDQQIRELTGRPFLREYLLPVIESDNREKWRELSHFE